MIGMQQTFVLFHQKRIQDRQKRDLIVEAFRRADKNKDGQLSVDEILSIYSEHGIENVSRDDIQRLVDEADKDGTGELSEKDLLTAPRLPQALWKHRKGNPPMKTKIKIRLNRTPIIIIIDKVKKLN
ncbi:CETN1 [Lepeophtheirus salmonis]|uniref:CETN1 n=1 Tax=Lepeophtheirus salmonis TaxID=72036 RepID=A0A7R8H3D1_LEPSM|nr:CETN1 [Lepeophtheirus salmonis]CAF2828077.1 CETN1 [Lepeophtheirus salmonis]